MLQPTNVRRLIVLGLLLAAPVQAAPRGWAVYDRFCLACHGGSQKFLARHEKDMVPSLLLDKTSCLDCHGPAHTPETGKQAVK